MWKLRWEKSHHALLDMATDKQTRDAEIVTLNRKCSLLQELCKAFQKERATLLEQLKDKTAGVDLEIEDDKKLMLSIENNVEDPLQEDPLKNGSAALLDSADIKTEEQTVEPKTEVDSTAPEASSSDAVSSSSSDKQDERVVAAPVNSIDVVPGDKDETQLTSSVGEVPRGGDVVPVGATRDPGDTKTASSPEGFVKVEDIKLEPGEEKKEEGEKAGESNGMQRAVDASKLGDRTQDSVMPEIKEEPKVQNHTGDVSKAIPNGEVHSNATTNKKHKVISSVHRGDFLVISDVQSGSVSFDWGIKFRQGINICSVIYKQKYSPIHL